MYCESCPMSDWQGGIACWCTESPVAPDCCSNLHRCCWNKLCCFPAAAANVLHATPQSAAMWGEDNRCDVAMGEEGWRWKGGGKNTVEEGHRYKTRQRTYLLPTTHLTPPPLLLGHDSCLHHCHPLLICLRRWNEIATRLEYGWKVKDLIWCS